MSASPNKNSDDKPTPPDRSTVILLLGIAGDTTWRMFTPILALTILGIWGDHTFGTKPVLTAIGIIIGVVIAGLLIKQQLQKDKK